MAMRSRMNGLKLIALMLGLMLAISGVALRAQSGNAQLSGLVTDNSGAMLPGAQVKALNTATNVAYTATADSAGSYLLPELLPGPYKVTVNASGFGAQTHTGLVLHTGDHLSLNFSLKPGAVETTITVTSAQTLLSTDEANSAAVLDNKMITELPQLNRDSLDLLQVVPSVQGTGPQVDNIVALTQGNAAYLVANTGNAFSVSGGQQNASNIVVDGNPVNESEFNNTNRAIPTPDSIGEFRVASGVLPADIGRYAGGVVLMQTQSGTNVYHGRLFFYDRNQDLNSNPWQNNAAGVARQDFQQKNYGAAGGGPVSIPGLFNGKDKTFFYFAWEGSRFTQGSLSENNVPTALNQQGNFSQTLIGFNGGSPIFASVYDPFNGYEDSNPADCTGPLASQYSSNGWCWVRPQFSNATIPATAGGGLSGQSQLFAHYMAMWPNPADSPIVVPEPSYQDHLNNYNAIIQLKIPSDKFSFRVDEALRPNHHIQATITRNMLTSETPAPFKHAATQLTTDEDWIGNFLYTWAVNPKTVFNFRLGVGVTDLVSVGVSGDGSLPDPDINTSTWGFDPLIEGNPAKLTNEIAPVVNIGGTNSCGSCYYTHVGGDQFDSFKTQSDNGTISLTRLWGRHTLKVGYEQYFVRFTEFGGDGTGVIGLGEGTSPVTGGPASMQYWNLNDGNSGSQLADLMLGSSNLNSWGSNWNITPYGWNQAAYIMDDWKVNSRLNVQIGLRWDHDGAKQGREPFGGLLYDLNAKNVLEPTSGWNWSAVQSAEGGALSGYATPAWVSQGATGRIALVNTTEYPQKNLYTTNIANLQPRIGVNYQIDAKTVAHIGLGMIDQGLNGLSTDWQSFYYNTAEFNQIDSQDGMHWISELCACDHGLRSFPVEPSGNLGWVPPVTNNTQYFYSTWNTNGNANGQGTTIGHYDTPMDYMWTASVQRELGKDWVVTGEYMGIRGIHLLMHVNGEWSLNNVPLSYYSLGMHLYDQVPNPFLNEGLNFQGATTVQLSQLLGLSPQYAGTNSATPGQVSWGKSFSNFANFQIQSRNYHGLQLLASYAIRKTLTDAGSTDINAQGLSYGLLQNPHNLMEGYGVATYEMPQTLKVNYSYDLPFGRGREYLNHINGPAGSVLDEVIGGWALAGISTWNAKGTPVQVPTVDGGTTVPGAALRWGFNNTNFRNSSVSYQKALVVNGSFANSNGEGVLNAASFNRTADFTLANSPVYFSNLRNPGAFYTDMSLLKKFYFSENHDRNFELRIEAENIFNHPVFGNIIADPDNPLFGGINGKTGQRVMQAGGRFFF